MSGSFLARFFTCILPQLLQQWWMACVGVFTTSSPSKESGAGEGEANINIDIEAGIRPRSEVIDISASTARQKPSIVPDIPSAMEKSGFVSISLRSNSSIASISIDRISTNASLSLTAPAPIPTRTSSIQIKVTKARTADTSSMPSSTLTPQEIVDLFHGKKNTRVEEEIHNEKTRNRVSSQRQSIVDPVKARILDAAMKQFQDRTVGVRKKVIITTPAVKITPSSVRVEYCQPPLFYSSNDQDKSSDTLLSMSDGSAGSNTSINEITDTSLKSKRRGIHFIQPPTTFEQLDASRPKQGSMSVVPPIILEPMQIPTPPLSVSGGSIHSAQSNESIQDIISMFPVPPVNSIPSSPVNDEKNSRSLDDKVTRCPSPYSPITISPSSSSESSSNPTLDISISSEEGEGSSVSDSVTSEGRTSPERDEAAVFSTTPKRLDAYYPPGISGKSKADPRDCQPVTPFLFPALPRTPPRPQETTHDRKQPNYLRLSSGEWLAKCSKLSPTSQSGRDSCTSQLSVSVSGSVSGLSVFTEQYHDVVNTFNKAVEDNRRKGGAFHFNQDSLSAVLFSSKEKQSTSAVDDLSRDEEKESRQDGSSQLTASDSKSTQDEDDREEETTSEPEPRYKSSLRKRPDSLLWFAALDEARAQEQAQQRASAWESNLDSDLFDEEYASTAALAVATPHQVERPVSPLKVVKKAHRVSAASSSDDADPDASQPSESLCGSENSRESVSHEGDAGRDIARHSDDEDGNEVSSDEMWFSSESDSTHAHGYGTSGQTTPSVTTLHTPELDANDVFARADESLDSTERSIDDILSMLDRRGSDTMKISGPGTPVDEKHVAVKTEQSILGSVSFNGAPASLHSLLSGKSTENIQVHTLVSVGCTTKRRQKKAAGSPWHNRPPVVVEDEEEDDDGDAIEECWGDLFSEINAV
ncbi:hypothetical protein BJ165DRAFT_1407476 [Panaeolus papilionaceus]|nr:hypothetical protein BJ165DRAFT_1407476 [Panaeolus papilionaceus]